MVLQLTHQCLHNCPPHSNSRGISSSVRHSNRNRDRMDSYTHNFTGRSRNRISVWNRYNSFGNGRAEADSKRVERLEERDMACNTAQTLQQQNHTQIGHQQQHLWLLSSDHWKHAGFWQNLSLQRQQQPQQRQQQHLQLHSIHTAQQQHQ